MSTWWSSLAGIPLPGLLNVRRLMLGIMIRDAGFALGHPFFLSSRRRRIIFEVAAPYRCILPPLLLQRPVAAAGRRTLN